MIDAAKTLERFGYLPSKWKSKSGKKVISICDECGAERVVRLAVAGKHCRTCAPKQPVTKAKVVAGLKRSWATARKNWKHSAATKEVLRGYQLGRPAWNKGLRGVFKPTAEHIAKLQAALKAKGRTPEHCQRISQALKGNTSSKGKHWVMSEQGKANLRASGAWKKGRPAWNKGKRLSPEHAAKAALANKGKIRSQDARDRASSSLKEYYRTNEHHQKGKPAWNKGKEGPWWQGDKNPNWSGGKSFEDYPREFNRALKLYIRQRDGDRCCLCGKSNEQELADIKQSLCVNHIDFNKRNCAEENLNVLCHLCNLKICKDRPYWTEYFTEQMTCKTINA